MSNRDRVKEILCCHGGSTPDIVTPANGITYVMCGCCYEVVHEKVGGHLDAADISAGRRALIDHVVDILDKEGLLT